MESTISFKVNGEILQGIVIGTRYHDNKIVGYLVRSNNKKDFPNISINNIISINGKNINK